MVVVRIGPRESDRFPWAVSVFLCVLVVAYVYGLKERQAEVIRDRARFETLRGNQFVDLLARIAHFKGHLSAALAGVREPASTGRPGPGPKKEKPGEKPGPGSGGGKPEDNPLFAEAAFLLASLNDAETRGREDYGKLAASLHQDSLFHRIEMGREGAGPKEYLFSGAFHGNLLALALYSFLLYLWGSHLEGILPRFSLFLLVPALALLGGFFDSALRAAGAVPALADPQNLLAPPPAVLGAGNLLAGLLGILLPFSFTRETQVSFAFLRGEVLTKNQVVFPTWLLTVLGGLAFFAFRLVGGDSGGDFTLPGARKAAMEGGIADIYRFQGPSPLSSAALACVTALLTGGILLLRIRKAKEPLVKLEVEQGIAEGENARLLAYVRDSRFQKALAFKAARKFGDAMDLLVLLRSDFADLPGIHVEIADLEKVRGNEDGARVALKKAVTLALDKKEEKLAIEVYKNLLRAYPKTLFLADEQRQMAEVLEGHGFYAESSQAYRWLYECYPKEKASLSALLKYGDLCFFKFNQARIAVEVLRTFYKHFSTSGIMANLDPKEVRTLLREERNLERALGRAGHLAEKAGEMTALKSLLCRALLDRSLMKDARDYLEDIRGEPLYQRDPKLKEMLSLCYEGEQEFDKAEAVWQEVIEEWNEETAKEEGRGKWWMAQFHVARLRLRAGKAAATLDLLDHLAAADPRLGGRSSLARFKTLIKPLQELSRAASLQARLQQVKVRLQAASQEYGPPPAEENAGEGAVKSEIGSK